MLSVYSSISATKFWLLKLHIRSLRKCSMLTKKWPNAWQGCIYRGSQKNGEDSFCLHINHFGWTEKILFALMIWVSPYFFLIKLGDSIDVNLRATDVSEIWAHSYSSPTVYTEVQFWVEMTTGRIQYKLQVHECFHRTELNPFSLFFAQGCFQSLSSGYRCSWAHCYRPKHHNPGTKN